MTLNILIGSIYIPCNYATLKLLSDLNKLIELANKYDGFVLGGDLNSRIPAWGDTKENSNRKILINWLLGNSLDAICICDSPPSYPNGCSFLDHFLLRSY